MFRQHLMPRACLTIALGLAVVAVPALSWGQDRSTEERLDRLERDLNMLQRQVYRGVPPPPAGADNGSAVSLEIRMDRLEQQMRDLTGRVEELGNQFEQIRHGVAQVGGDGRAPAGPAAAGGSPGAPPAYPATAGNTGDELPPPRTAGAPPSPPGGPAAGPTPIFGTLTPPGARPRASALASAPPEAPGPLPSGSAAEQYKHAFDLLRKADYPAAATAFTAFVARHPDDRLAGAAQYWLGETYYARGRFMEAASAFAEGYKRYPKSPKAADDLLKLAMSLGRANEKRNACVALAQLDHDFPHPGAAIKTRAAAEKKRLGC